MKSFQSFISFLPFRVGTSAGLLAGSLLLLGSCVQESFVADNGDGAPVEILLNGGVGSLTASGSTRAVVDDDYITANNLPVSIARRDQNADGTWPTYKDAGQLLDATRVKGMGQTAINFAAQQFYQVRSTYNDTRLISFYPPVGTYGIYYAETSPFDLTKKDVIVFNMSNGCVDVMVSELLTGNKATPFGSAGKQFTYKHVLTQVVVKAYGDAATAANWGVIQSVKVKRDAPGMTLELNSGAVTNYAGSSYTLLRFPGTDVPMSSSLAIPNGAANKVTCGYMIGTFPSYSTLTVEVITSLGGTHTLTVNPPSGVSAFEKGKSYTIELVFSTSKISPSSTIGTWTNGGDVTGNVQV